MQIYVNINSLENTVLKHIKNSKYDLNLAKQLIDKLSIPSDFTYSTKLKNIPQNISTIYRKIIEIEVWLNTAINHFSWAETNNTNLIESLTSTIPTININTGGKVVSASNSNNFISGIKENIESVFNYIFSGEFLTDSVEMAKKTCAQIGTYTESIFSWISSMGSELNKTSASVGSVAQDLWKKTSNSYSLEDIVELYEKGYISTQQKEIIETIRQIEIDSDEFEKLYTYMEGELKKGNISSEELSLITRILELPEDTPSLLEKLKEESVKIKVAEICEIDANRIEDILLPYYTAGYVCSMDDIEELYKKGDISDKQLTFINVIKNMDSENLNNLLPYLKRDCLGNSLSFEKIPLTINDEKIPLTISDEEISMIIGLKNLPDSTPSLSELINNKLVQTNKEPVKIDVTQLCEMDEQRIGRRILLSSADCVQEKQGKDKWYYDEYLVDLPENIIAEATYTCGGTVCSAYVASVLWVAGYGTDYQWNYMNTFENMKSDDYYVHCAGLYRMLINILGWEGAGTKITSFDDLQPGDIVIYSRDEEMAGDGRKSHTNIYLGCVDDEYYFFDAGSDELIKQVDPYKDSNLYNTSSDDPYKDVRAFSPEFLHIEPEITELK